MKQQDYLLTKYLPGNYTDSFTETITDKPYISAQELFNLIFLQYPKWVLSLLKLRDMIVKPFGLKTNKSFEDMVIEQNNNEIILGSKDRHLTFYVSLYCSDMKNRTQSIRITTLVKYENILGKIYFAIIWLFHKTIVHYLLKRAVKNGMSSLCRNKIPIVISQSVYPPKIKFRQLRSMNAQFSLGIAIMIHTLS